VSPHRDLSRLLAAAMSVNAAVKLQSRRKFYDSLTSGPETTEGRIMSQLLFEMKITLELDGVLRNALILV
jgi:hypothetical protein